MTRLRRLISGGLWLTVTLSAVASLGQETAPVSNPFDADFVDLTDQVFVALRPEPTRSPVQGNSVVIITDRDVIVFDAGGAPRAARGILEEIRRRTDRPIRYVINSHAHLDHTGGNLVYRDAFPGLEIVAGPGTRDYMLGVFGDRYAYVREIAEDPADSQTRGEAWIRELAESGDDRSLAVARRQARYYRQDILLESEGYREVEIVPPTMTLTTRLELSRKPSPLEIAHIGYGKTPGDLILHLPEAGIVATGDILTHPIPYGFSRSPTQWLETLRALADLDAQQYVPGHGQVLSDTDYLDQVIDLVETLLKEVDDAIDRGLDREQTLAAVSLTSSRLRFTHGDPVLDYLFEEWFQKPATGRAFDELSKLERSDPDTR